MSGRVAMSTCVGYTSAYSGVTSSITSLTRYSNLSPLGYDTGFESSVYSI